MKSLDSRLAELQKKYDIRYEEPKMSGLILIQKDGKLYDYDSKTDKHFEWVEPPKNERKYKTLIVIPYNYREPFNT